MTVTNLHSLPDGNQTPHSGETDNIDAFVSDLRELWKAQGEPKFSALAARSSVSRTSLNDAVTRTDRLPSKRVLVELVRLLDASQIDTWIQRRENLANPTPEDQPKPAAGGEVSTPTPAPSDGTPPSRSTRRWWPLVSAVAAATVVAGGVGYAVGQQRGFHQATVAAEEKQAATLAALPKDGDDPIKARCINDATVTNSSEVPGVGRLEVRYSANCRAFWARLVRLDHQDQNRSYVQMCRGNEPNVCDEADFKNASNLYTFILTQRSNVDTFCATGSVFVGEREIKLSRNPLC